MNKALYADGFEEAIIGVGIQFNTKLVAYDYDKCVKILMTRDGMSEDDAIEYVEYNVTGSWMGDNTPVFVKVGLNAFPDSD